MINVEFYNDNLTVAKITYVISKTAVPNEVFSLSSVEK